MTEILPFLKDLLSAPGLSGNEAPVRRLIEDAWRPLTDELSVSRLGSLHGLRRGSGPEPRPSLLLAAHMDAIGMLVTGVVEGFLRIGSIGGVDARVLPGQPVTVHARRDLPGVIVQPPLHLLPAEYREAPVPLEYLLVDTGLLPDEVDRLVRPGDTGLICPAPASSWAARRWLAIPWMTAPRWQPLPIACKSCKGAR